MRPMLWPSQFIMHTLSKRTKFVVATVFLTILLFVSFHLNLQFRIIFVSVIALLSSLALFIILYNDLKQRSQLLLLILPLFYTLAFGFFYWLLPARFLTRAAVASFYSIGLYALYLSHNIYAVAGIRNIQLLKAAHSVGFLLTVLTHFFLINIFLSLHLTTIYNFVLALFLSFILTLPLIWNINLESSISKRVIIFSSMLAFVIGQLALILTFWPAHPTVAALFLSGNFYTLVGLSQAWLERRLFKNTLWEFVGVAIIVLLVLVVFTKWGG